MDPLTALSVAGTIVQFADFGIRLFSESRKLYRSSKGVLTANQEIELIATDIRGLVVKIQESEHSILCGDSQGTTSQENDVHYPDTFRQICCDVVILAEELLENLRKLKMGESNHPRWESIQKAIKGAWAAEDIKSLTDRLSKLREAILAHTLFYINEKLDRDSLQQSFSFATLDHQTKLIFTTLLKHTIEEKSLLADVQDQIATIIQLIRRSDAINGQEHQRIRDKILEPCVASHKPTILERVTASIEMLVVSSAEEERVRKTVQEKIINSLEYPGMAKRYENIVDAYPKTFEWPFHDSTATQLPWESLCEWLKSGSGVYWINGKAGSGKSTLMKHIYDEDRTRKYLEMWAHPGKATSLCLATFFFWNSGTREQRSQTGLLRSLLHQVLQYQPDLVHVAFPDLWAKGYARLLDMNQQILVSPPIHSFPLKKLMAAFKAIIHQSSIEINICFLVDGLDEFEGDHGEMSELFKEITEVQNVKACLSSRPHIVFERSFEGCPSLMLQDLTRTDIEFYVRGRFNRNPSFQDFMQRNSSSTNYLLDEIIRKAAGVFLWVQVVVGSLLGGIENRDEIAMLHQRLRLMPPELEPLYRHLLDQIEPIYKVWASKAFQIIRAYRFRQCCSDSSEWPPALHQNHTPFRLSTLYYAMSDTLEVSLGTMQTWVHERIHSTSTQVFTTHVLVERCENMRFHLTARCAGLLEVPSYKTKGPKAEIEYLHRTARDFLEDQDNWSVITDHTRGTDFDPCKAISNIGPILLAMKTSESGGCGHQKVSRIVNKSLLCAYKMSRSQESDETITKILETFVLTTTKWENVRYQKSALSVRQKGKNYSGYQVEDTDYWISRLISKESLPQVWRCVGLAVLFGYVEHVQRKWTELRPGPSITTRLLQSLVGYRQEYDQLLVPEPRQEMVYLLLDQGADSNLGQGPPFERQRMIRRDAFSEHLQLDVVEILRMASEKKKHRKRQNVEVADENRSHKHR